VAIGGETLVSEQRLLIITGKKQENSSITSIALSCRENRVSEITRLKSVFGLPHAKNGIEGIA
jgi:hypothetical protein